MARRKHQNESDSSSESEEDSLSALQPPDLSPNERKHRPSVTITHAGITAGQPNPYEPWISLEHPVDLYEGFKLVLMFPVVVIKVRSQLPWHLRLRLRSSYPPPVPSTSLARRPHPPAASPAPTPPGSRC